MYLPYSFFLTFVISSKSLFKIVNISLHASYVSLLSLYMSKVLSHNTGRPSTKVISNSSAILYSTLQYTSTPNAQRTTKTGLAQPYYTAPPPLRNNVRRVVSCADKIFFRAPLRAVYTVIF